MTRSLVLNTYELLYASYGPQYWWPGESPWEICVGAVLTQNTNWTNVEKAIVRLKAAGPLTPQQIIGMSDTALEEAIMPSGFFRLKNRRLRAVTHWWLEHVADDRPQWRGRSLTEYRRDLLLVNGVGPETADSILLYCFDLPVFVIDAYTRRIASRHLGADRETVADYHQLQRFFTDALPVDARLYNEYHALLVRLAKECCRKSGCRNACLPAVP